MQTGVGKTSRDAKLIHPEATEGGKMNLGSCGSKTWQNIARLFLKMFCFEIYSV